jgi:hypothetical protein
MRSDPTLKRYYREFNRKFWGNTLPNNVVVRWGTDDDIYEGNLKRSDAGVCLRHGPHEPMEIVLDPVMRREKQYKHTKLTLHHEMIHVKTKNRDNHGPVFKKYRDMLIEKGAIDPIF